MKKFMSVLLIFLVFAFFSCKTMKRQISVKIPETKEEQISLEKQTEQLYNQGKYVEAVENLKALLEKDPKNPVYWNQLGSVYAQMNEYEYAIFSYKKALKYNPKNTKALYNLSVIYSEKGDADEALKMIKNAIKIDPKNPILYLST